MSFKFNPFTGNLDKVEETNPAGNDTEIQFNDGGSFGSSSDFTIDGTNLNLNGTFEVDKINRAGTFTTNLFSFDVTTGTDLGRGNFQELGILKLYNESISGGNVGGQIQFGFGNALKGSIDIQAMGTGKSDMVFMVNDGTSMKENFRIPYDGNINIGKLNGTANGTISIYNSGSANIRKALTIANGTTGTAGVEMALQSVDNNGTYGDLATIGARKTSSTVDHVTADLIFSTTFESLTSTEQMRLTSNGDLGIGTSTPQGKLDINTSGSVGMYFRTHSVNDSIEIVSYGNTGHIYFSPKTEYTVFSSSNSNNATMQIEAINSKIRLYGSGTNSIDSERGTDLEFRGNNTERMRMTNAGNFGIATSSPSEKLHVTGNVYIEGGKLIMDSTTKQWEITVDDTGTLTTTEVV